MKLRAKFGLYILTTAIFSLLVWLIVFYATRSVDDAFQRDRDADKIMEHTFELKGLTYSYLILRQEKLRTDWKRRHESLGKLINVQLRGSESARRAMLRLRDNYQKAGALFDSLSGETLQQSGPGYGARNQGMTGSREERLIALIEEIANDANQLNLEADSDLKAIQKTASSRVASLMGLLMIGTCIFALVLSRTIMRSVRLLATATSEVASGNLDYNIDLTGIARDELGELSRDFNKMALQLKDFYVRLREEIAERVAAEQALQKLLIDLELRVDERTRELSKANLALRQEIDERERTERDLMERTGELETVNKELESFSYSVSHDLRTPLRAIGGFSRMLLKDSGDKLDAEAKRRLDTILANTETMDRLIEDLLTFSRLGRQEMVRTSLDMEGLVQSAWNELVAAHQDHGLKLELNKLPGSTGDPRLIKQVMLNLLSNAVKFSKPTGGCPIVAVGSFEEREDTVYFVKDNGVGFDMGNYGRLFGVFQRLHSSEEFEGNGVGLAIVERIIRRHGGRVWAEGKVGRGATFYFTLKGGV